MVLRLGGAARFTAVTVLLSAAAVAFAGCVIDWQNLERQGESSGGAASGGAGNAATGAGGQGGDGLGAAGAGGTATGTATGSTTTTGAENGQPCTSPAGCESGFCVDDLCCDSACGGLCQTCIGSDSGGVDGTCGDVEGGTDPDQECPFAAQCDGDGHCVEPNGSACDSGSECASGHCVDDVCCEQACTGLCRACVGAKTSSADGICDFVRDDTDPDDECTSGMSPDCNGSGSCGN